MLSLPILGMDFQLIICCTHLTFLVVIDSLALVSVRICNLYNNLVAILENHHLDHVGNGAVHLLRSVSFKSGSTRKVSVALLMLAVALHGSYCNVLESPI